MSYRGFVINDWSQVDFATPQGRLAVRGALEHFLQLPTANKEVRAALQHFTLMGDFPAQVRQVLDKYHVIPNFDMGYEAIYRVRDFRGTREDGFKILDVTSGLTFVEMPTDGAPLVVHKTSGTLAEVTFAKYGGALGWAQTTLDDNKYWELEDTTLEFRNKAYYKMAQVFYALIDALPSDAAHDVAWAGSASDSTATRDIMTITAACEELLVANKDKGWGLTPNTEFVLLAPIQLKTRYNAALSQLNQAVQGSSRTLVYNVRVIYTMMLAAANVAYVWLPGIKNQIGYRQDLTVKGMEDILTDTQVVAGWMRYGGAINADQGRRIATA